MKLSILSLITLLVLASPLFAQVCFVKGNVSDAATKETLVGATVMIQGTTSGTITDFDGNFKIEKLNPGIYNFVVSFVSYNPQILKVDLKNSSEQNLKIELKPASLDINEIKITARKRENTDMALLTSIKLGNLNVSGISAQQISKSQDKDASEVVKRVPGISIHDGRFIIVRGLTERYNTVWLNNTSTPSSESDQRAFSFDIIPSSMIDNILIFKTTSPENPGDFTGGFINIITKNIPDKNSFNISYSVSYNSESTGKELNSFNAGKRDFLEFANSKSGIPSDFPSDLRNFKAANFSKDIHSSIRNQMVRDTLAYFTRKLNTDWKQKNIITPLDQRIGLNFNFRFKLGNVNIGNITAASFSKTYTLYQVYTNNYGIYDYEKDQARFNDRFTDIRSNETGRVGFIHNWTFQYKGQKIGIRNLFNQSGITSVGARTGKEYYTGNDINSREMKYTGKQTYSGQVGGEHKFFDDHTVINWNLGYSNTLKNEPDIRRYKQIRDPVDTTKYFIPLQPSGEMTNASRFFFKLNEDLYSIGINIKQILKIGNYLPEIKAGFFEERSTRQFFPRNFGYAPAHSNINTYYQPIDSLFGLDNIDGKTGVYLKEQTDRSDSYTASNLTRAYYFAFKIPLGKFLNIYTGVRAEHNMRDLKGFLKGTTDSVRVHHDTIDYLPSVNATFNINEKNLIRLAYGRSINRPEYREIAPFYYLDFDKAAGVTGNPTLKQCNIHNYDLRYEWYPASGEMLNVGVFYKYFYNPIEMVIMDINSPMQYSFQNVLNSTSYGAELEMRKSIDAILPHFSLLFNASIIKSKVKYPSGKLERDRPMQGQSPYIINAGIYYQHDSHGIIASLLYNRIGKRIVAVGEVNQNAIDNIPDIYEMPRNSLDLTITKKFWGKLEVKGGIKDILNEQIEFQQTYKYTNPVSGNTISRNLKTKNYLPGRNFTIGVSYAF
jgi:hypothetical protein